MKKYKAVEVELPKTEAGMNYMAKEGR